MFRQDHFIPTFSPIRYENESLIRQCVKADVDNLHRILDKTCLAKADLEMQTSNLQEELVYLKKSHQEVCSSLPVAEYSYENFVCF